MLRRITTAAALVALAMPVTAQAQYVLNVREADIRVFVEDAAKVTGRTFIVDGRVQGKVSVVTDRPLSRSEYFEVFLSTLRANGLVAVPTASGAFRIQPAEGAASQPGRMGSRGAPANQMVTEVFRLRAIDSASAVETLRPLVSKEGSVTANRAGNSLVVVDYADNVRRIRALLTQIDRDNAATQMVSLEHAGAREIATALAALVPNVSVGGGGGENAAPVAGGPPASVVAVDSANAVVMRGDPQLVARLATLARELDAKAANGAEIQVLWLNHIDAAQLLPVLERLVGAPSVSPAASTGSAEGGAATPATGGSTGSAVALSNGRGNVVITRMEGANAIILSAPVDVQRRLGQLIRQLDVRQDQVLVEAIIVEISDSLAKELGVQFLLGGKDIPFAATNFSNVTPNILDLAGGILADEFDRSTTTSDSGVVTTTTNSAVGDLLRQNAAQAALAARGGFGGFALDLGNNRVLGAIINAIEADTQSSILSTPHITTNNNMKASILFGQEIPVSTGEALSNNFDNAFRTIQRQNVGIELEVTPQIMAGSEVRLDLRQEVSSIVGPVSDDFNELIINKREITTTLTVGDGEIVSLGGLLDDNERRTIQKIPLLGDLPIIGELFRSRGKAHVKTNLMVFIRPTILRSRADRDALTARRYQSIREAQMGINPGMEPSIDNLVLHYLGTNPPAAMPRPDDVVVMPDASNEAIRPVETITMPASDADGQLPPNRP